MTKKLIRLTEGDLHRIIKESVNNVLNEINVLGKIPNFDGKQSYGEHFKTVDSMHKYFGTEPKGKENKIPNNEYRELADDEIIKIANFITKERVHFKVMPLAKRKPMIQTLRDFAKHSGLDFIGVR